MGADPHGRAGSIYQIEPCSMSEIEPSSKCLVELAYFYNPADGRPVGQNQAAIRMNSQQMSAQEIRASFANMPQGWYDEVEDPGFDRNGVDNFRFKSGTGHYTQVVWADTDEVGCGLVYYLDGSWFTTLVHCNYATAGNWGGQSLYRRGEPCTECPEGFNFCENGLCSKERL